MHKYREVGKRITGLLLAVCMFATLFCDIPVHAADGDTGLDISTTTITLYTDAACTAANRVGATTYTYTGSEIEPYLKVTDSNNTVLQQNTDYVIDSYSDNINAGTAKVTIRGMGRYNSGTTKDQTYTINRVTFKSINVTYNTTCTYIGAATRPNITAVSGTVQGGGTRELSSADYTVNYYNDTIIGDNKAYFTITPNTTNYNYPNAATDYNYYSIYYDINTSAITAQGLEGLVFNGFPQTPDVTIYNGSTSISSSNYEIRWSNNTNAGTNSANLIIDGMGDYRGTKEIPFSIEKRSLTDAAVSISMNPNQLIFTGEQIPILNYLTVTITSKDAQGADRTYSVPADNNYTATYTGQDNTDFVGQSIASISALPNGNLSGTKTMGFTVSREINRADVLTGEYTYTGSGIVPSLRVLDSTGADVSSDNYTITYYPTDAYESGQGTTVVPTSTGEYWIKITGIGTKFYSGTVGGTDNKLSYRIVPKSIANANVIVGDGVNDIVYNGEADRLPTITVKDGGMTLSETVDYSKEYYTTAACTEVASGDKAKNAGTYYVKITGLNSYAGSEKVISYQIRPIEVVSSDITLTVEDATYTGSALEPKVTSVTLNVDGKSIALTNNSGYTCTYENNVNIGTKTGIVTVTLTGNYVGTAKKNFSIVHRALTDCVFDNGVAEEEDTVLNVTYNGTVQTPAEGISLKDGTYTLVRGTDYSVQCKNKESGANIDGLEQAGSCDVVITGLNNYSGSSITKTFTVKQKDITGSDIEYVMNTVTYNPAVLLENAVTVSDKSTGKLLPSGVANGQYIIKYFKDAQCTESFGTMAAAGTFYAQITGRMNYTGTKVVGPMNIGTDISTAIDTVTTGDTTYVYDGTNHYESIRDGIVVTSKEGFNMTANTDYTVCFYSDNTYSTKVENASNGIFVNAGNIYVSIDGTGRYYGSYQRFRVTINPKSIGLLSGEITGTRYYNGTSHEPAIYNADIGINPEGWIKVKDIKNGSDYYLTTNDLNVTYSNNIAASKNAVATLTGKGNYTGTLALNFTIIQLTLTDLVQNNGLTVDVSKATFNGLAQAATVDVRYTWNDATVVLRQNTDFTVEYYGDALCTISPKDMVSATTRYLKITGIGNYAGTLPGSGGSSNYEYVIEPYDLTSSTDIYCDLEGTTHKYSTIMTSDKVPAFNVRLISTNYTLKSDDYSYEKTALVDTIGSTSLILQGTGNFTGRRVISYAYTGELSTDINLGDSINAYYDYNSNQSGGEVKPIPKIYYGSKLLNNSDFTISYLNADKVGEATLVIEANATNLYWDGTYRQTYKIKGDIADAEVTIPAQTYTGNSITSLRDMQVICNGYTLTLGKDYTINTDAASEGYSFLNNIDGALADTTDTAHSPTVMLTGAGEYFDGHPTSVKTAYFDIKYDLSKAKVSATTTKPWTGTEVKLDDLTVSYDTPSSLIETKVDFEEGRDYTLTYHNNTSVGDMNGTSGPYVTITPTADGLLLNNNKTVNVPFSIGKLDISRGVINGVEESYLYTWDDTNRDRIKPSTLSLALDGNTIDASNYDVSYAVIPYTGDEADIAAVETITLTGKGNYFGTISKTFNILKRDLSKDVTVSFTAADNLVYNGSEQTPEYTITYIDYEGNTKELPTKDYTLAWGNNVDACSESVVNAPYLDIAADSNYCMNSRRTRFTINPLDVSQLYYIPGEIADMSYTAGVHRYEPTVTVKLSRNALEPLKSNLDDPENPDYRISYGNNTGVLAENTEDPINGPHILITAKSSNYTGTYYIPFSITARSLTTLAEDESSYAVGISLRDSVDKLNKLPGEDGDILYNYEYDKNDPTKTYQPVPDLVDVAEDGKNVELTEGVDYTVSYVNNNIVGTAQVVLTGIGNYAGTRTVDFTIGTMLTDEMLGDSYNPTIVLESDILDGNTKLTYDGKEHKLENEPDFKIYEWLNGSKDSEHPLEMGVDYSIAYYSNPQCTTETNCIHAGTVYVKISGLATGGYVGSIVKTYTIERKNINSADIVVSDIPDTAFNGTSVAPRPTITDLSIGGESGTAINGECEFTYADNAAISTDANNPTVIITGSANGNYTGIRRVNFKITRQNIDDATIIIDKIPDQMYSGSRIMPKLTIHHNGILLVEGKDYKLTYGNNTNAGIYNQVSLPNRSWVGIQGIGNYSNGNYEADNAKSKIIYFNIIADLDTATVETITTQAYTGSQIRPAVKVKCGGNTLIAGTDYAVVYDENVSIGEGALTILPTTSSCYTGSKLVKFYIGNSIAGASVMGVPSSQTYTGKAIVPEPAVKIGQTELKKGTDYSVQWRNNIKAGTASVVITGIGTYAGTKTVNYQIIAKGITRCTISSIADIVYDGNSHSPTVVIRDGNKVLANGTDYTLTDYMNNKLPGTASITLTGQGNYSGSTTLHFNIVVAPMSGVVATPSTKSIKLAWDARNNVTGYQIYTSDCRTRLAQVKTTAKTISKLKQGKSYTYKVRTYLKVGKKTYYGSFTTVKTSTKPSTVTLKTVISSKNRQAVVSWNKVSNASGYVVYRKSSAKGKFKAVATITSKSKVSYTDKKLTRKKTYYYKVRAYRKVGGKKIYGSYSSTISVKVK